MAIRLDGLKCKDRIRSAERALCHFNNLFIRTDLKQRFTVNHTVTYRFYRANILLSIKIVISSFFYQNDTRFFLCLIRILLTHSLSLSFTGTKTKLYISIIHKICLIAATTADPAIYCSIARTK